MAAHLRAWRAAGAVARLVDNAYVLNRLSRGLERKAAARRWLAQTKTTWSRRYRPSPSCLPAPWRIARVTTVGWATRRLASVRARRPHVHTFGATASYGDIWAPPQRKPRSTQGTTIPHAPAPSWTTG
jgi:hypothetical protein